MNKTRYLAGAAVVGFLVMSATAYAQTAVTATTDLNIRSGPGPQHPVVGVVNANEGVTLTGCMEGSKWCSIDHAGGQGWVYSDYLTADVSGAPVVISQRPAEVAVPVVTYDNTAMEAGGAAGVTTGAATGAVAGALIGGPIGAAIGGVAGAAAGGMTGATVGAIVEPPEEVRTYVTTNAAEPVYLDGEVVVGAGLPETVQLRPIPNYQYNYVYVNGLPVLVDPANRQIVHVIR
ncbi:MAG TPA: DUF1236 domain-containing protein [Propylenella sp.]|nr:DUF1236 domain-containing protein [Propylenella sp.]